MKPDVKISIPEVFHENVRRYIDANVVLVEWERGKEISLAKVLDYVMKQMIESGEFEGSEYE